MEESVTRKRSFAGDNAKEKNKLYMYEELVVLVGTRSTPAFVPDPLSICLRATILGELIVQNAITQGPNNTVVARASEVEDYMSCKALEYIKQTSCTIQKWLDILNGESFSAKHRYQIKRVRAKIYKRLCERKILAFNHRIYSMAVTIIDNDTRNRAVCGVIEYLGTKREKSVRMDILVCCLHFCKGLAPVLASLTRAKQDACMESAENIVALYKNYYRRECPQEDMAALMLKALLAK